MLDLATRDADDAAWDDLAARSARRSVGQEHVEVLDMRVVVSLRRGRIAAARRALNAAASASARIPNVLGARLRRHAAELARAEATGTSAAVEQPSAVARPGHDRALSAQRPA
jgi:hypothetical protein